MPIAALLGFLLFAQAAPVGQGPERFFVGRTESRGTVSIALSGRHAIRDRSTGRIERGNTLVIDQQFEEEGKPARNRTWRLTRTADNRITGTISDARGPVTGDVTGNVIHLRYQSGEGPGVEQWITLDPNGRLARNRMVFRRLGITLATVESVSWRVE
jgi:hypothetical protein